MGEILVVEAQPGLTNQETVCADHILFSDLVSKLLVLRYLLWKLRLRLVVTVIVMQAAKKLDIGSAIKEHT